MYIILKVIQTATTTLLIVSLSACVSSSYPPSSANVYYGNSWGYDRYYRSGINRHYYPRTRPIRAPVRRGRY